MQKRFISAFAGVNRYLTNYCYYISWKGLNRLVKKSDMVGEQLW